MSHMQQCVLPEECVCEVAGVRYWPGQQIKVDCEICVCERGRPQRCQPNPDCTGRSVKYTALYHFRDQHQIHSGGLLIYRLFHTAVHCGWSSWSEWGECLGPCGVQSVQWSFRSPNNPTKHGDGRTCRGIYRKARRYVAHSSWYCFHDSKCTLLNLCQVKNCPSATVKKSFLEK